MRSLRSQRGFTVIELVSVIGIWFLFGVVGWCLNLYQAIHHAPHLLAESTFVWILHAVGVVAVPLGSVMGWLGLLFGVV